MTRGLSGDQALLAPICGSCNFGTAGKDEQSWFLDDAFGDDLTWAHPKGWAHPCLSEQLPPGDRPLSSCCSATGPWLPLCSAVPVSHQHHVQMESFGMSHSPCCLLCLQQPGQRPCHGQSPQPAALWLVLVSLRTFM